MTAVVLENEERRYVLVAHASKDTATGMGRPEEDKENQFEDPEGGGVGPGPGESGVGSGRRVSLFEIALSSVALSSPPRKEGEEQNAIQKEKEAKKGEVVVD